jgi:hypothetical protein
MRVGLLWSRPSGYMAACWAALEAVDVALNVIALRPGIENNSPFEDSVFSTLPLTLISDQEARDRAFVSDLVTSVSPDLLLVSGWWNPVYRSVARAAGIPYIVLVLASCCCPPSLRSVSQSGRGRGGARGARLATNSTSGSASPSDYHASVWDCSTIR